MFEALHSKEQLARGLGLGVAGVVVFINGVLLFTGQKMRTGISIANQLNMRAHRDAGHCVGPRKLHMFIRYTSCLVPRDLATSRPLDFSTF
jgi:hypothetical protein